MGGAKRPMCAAVLVRPFARFLRTHAAVPSDFADQLDVLAAADGQIALGACLELMQRAVALTGDVDLGLRAALFTEIGDFEVLEWVATSAATWREANETACRYARVLNEAADYRLREHEGKAHLSLGSAVALPRVATDYQLASYHMAIQLRVHEVPPELEVWMQHAEPADVSGYRAIFPSAKLVFNAPFDGFVTDAWRLEGPLPTANPALHRVLRAHADDLLQEIAPGDDLIQRVRADILVTLRHTATAERTAARLGMSRRTLTRRLAQLDTTYSRLLQEARYRTAIHFLRNTTHRVEDIAFLLGFSECAPFVRAFKRWSGSPPLEYRRRARAG